MGTGEGPGTTRGSPVWGVPHPCPQGWCAPSPVPGGGGGGGGGWDSWSGSCGGGAGSGCLLFCKSGLGTGLSGLPPRAPCVLLGPGLTLAGRLEPMGWRRVARMREAARRLPGAHLGVFRAFLERAKPGGRSRGWDDSRGCCLLRLEEKRGSVSVRKLYWFPALRRPGCVLLGSQGRDCRVSFCEEPLFFVGFFFHPQRGSDRRLGFTSALFCRWGRVEPSQMVLS